MRAHLALTVLLLALPAARALAAAPIKLAVMPTQFDKSSKGKVPALFDDYVLTAVQNNSGGAFQVIGQDDISQLLGLQQQKDLLDCSDTSCIASIGGALGVDRIIVIKIARLNDDWVATGKVINIKETKVESRINEIVAGDVRKLLESVPAVVSKLLAPVVTKVRAEEAAAPPRPSSSSSSSSSSSPSSSSSSASSASSSSSSHPSSSPAAAESQPGEGAPAKPPAATVDSGGGRGGVPLWVPIVTAGAGLALLGGGVAMGLVAAERNACNQSAYCAGGQVAAGEANDAALTANILYVAGGVVAATGGVLFFFIRRGGGDEHAALVPLIGRGGIGLALSGSFE